MSYYYLGSPYSKYPEGRAMACVEACRNAALLIRSGIPVFSPIAHSHAVAEYGQIDPDDHGIWLPLDRRMMAAAGGLIVLQLAQWWTSYGLTTEIDEFHSIGKPIVYMIPGTVPEVLKQEGR